MHEIADTVPASGASKSVVPFTRKTVPPKPYTCQLEANPCSFIKHGTDQHTTTHLFNICLLNPTDACSNAVWVLPALCICVSDSGRMLGARQTSVNECGMKG